MTRRSRGYLLNWIALLVLATLSFVLSHLSLGVWGMPIAILIGTAKALLIVFFFMHLTGYVVSARIAICTAVGLILLLGGFMVSDVMTRGTIEPEAQIGTLAIPLGRSSQR